MSFVDPLVEKSYDRSGNQSIPPQTLLRTVHQCVEAGLVDDNLLHIDSTLIAANASKDSVLKTSPELIAALRQACQHQKQKLEVLPPAEGAGADEAQLPLSPSSPAGVCAQNTSVNQTHLSTTDPQADLARDKSGVSRLCYKEHRMVDDACGVITAVKTTGATIPNGAQLAELYQQHQNHSALVVAQPSIAGDKHYGTAANYRYCMQQGIRPHLGEAVNGVAGRGLFDPRSFVYEPELDQFRCPAGQVLGCINVARNSRPRLTESNERNCAGSVPCEIYALVPNTGVLFKSLKTTGSSKQPGSKRTVLRRDEAEDGAATSWKEASLTWPTITGPKRARWRRLARQQMQSRMITAVQNIRILLRHELKRGGGEAAMITVLLPSQQPLRTTCRTILKQPKTSLPVAPSSCCQRRCSLSIRDQTNKAPSASALGQHVREKAVFGGKTPKTLFPLPMELARRSLPIQNRPLGATDRQGLYLRRRSRLRFSRHPSQPLFALHSSAKSWHCQIRPRKCWKFRSLYAV